MTETVHECPAKASGLMPCCGQSPVEVPNERMTLDVSLVTCTGPATAQHCRWCEGEHDPRYLCDAAKRLLDALHARGAELTVPDVTFPEPIPAHELGLDLDPTKGDRLAAQIVVEAGVVDVNGVARPVLFFTGLDSYRQPLPKWMFVGDAQDIDGVARLVSRMAALGIRTARQQNRRRA